MKHKCIPFLKKCCTSGSSLYSPFIYVSFPSSLQVKYGKDIFFFSLPKFKITYGKSVCFIFAYHFHFFCLYSFSFLPKVQPNKQCEIHEYDHIKPLPLKALSIIVGSVGLKSQPSVKI